MLVSLVASPAPAAQPSVAEAMFGSAGALFARLERLSVEQLALNAALSLAVAVGVALSLWLARRGLCALLARPGANGRSVFRRAMGLSWALARLLAVAVAMVAVLRVWGFDLVGWVQEGAGAGVLRSVVRSAVIVVLAAAFSEASSLLLTRALGRYARDRARGRRAGQLRTLAPLLRGLIHGVVWVLAVLTVLSEWGLKVGPLLAGAGVVGIAVGFGAQTLVKDLLTGFFLVLEDIVAVGDTVRIGDSSGQVEAMTLRTIRLRDTDGALHVFPYGEAQVIHNSTASFSYAVFDLSVGYGADVDRALALMADTGAALRADPAFAPKILEPFEVMGVERLSETAVVLKGRVKTCPGDQGAVAREYHRRIKLAFDAACVPAPWPQASLFRPDGAPAH